MIKLSLSSFRLRKETTLLVFSWSIDRGGVGAVIVTFPRIKPKVICGGYQPSSDPEVTRELIDEPVRIFLVWAFFQNIQHQMYAFFVINEDNNLFQYKQCGYLISETTHWSFPFSYAPVNIHTASAFARCLDTSVCPCLYFLRLQKRAGTGTPFPPHVQWWVLTRHSWPAEASLLLYSRRTWDLLDPCLVPLLPPHPPTPPSAPSARAESYSTYFSACQQAKQGNCLPNAASFFWYSQALMTSFGMITHYYCFILCHMGEQR